MPSAFGSPTVVASAAALAIATASAWRARGTSMRVGALHDWPLFMKQLRTPPFTERSRSASSRMMLADLPPSSCATRFTVSAAFFATWTPARVEPVNDTMSMPGCEARAAPTVGPSPFTRLKTPAGTPASCRISATTSRAERRHLARLQHHRAAGGERRRDLAHDLVHRPVPRRDEAADADRLAHDARRAFVLDEAVVLQHLERLHEVGETRRRLRRLGEPHRRAHLERDRGRDLVELGLVDADDALEQRDALLARGAGEGLEGLPRGGHGRRRRPRCRG